MNRALRLLLHGPLDAALNMGVDEMLLEAPGPRFPYTLRFYSWCRPTVSLGYAQPWRQGFDAGLARRQGVSLVRRITGGRAVLHADEITYAVAGPAVEGPFAGGIQDTYRVIGEGLVVGMQRLGVPATLERARGRRQGETAAGACFASRSRYELLADERKLLGSAQRRTPRRVLQHGSLPLGRPDPRRWAVLGLSGAEAASTSVGLAELLRPLPSRRRLVAVLAAALGERLDMPVRASVLSREEWREARRRASRYRDPQHVRQR